MRIEALPTSCVITAFLIRREKMAQAYDFALDKIGMEIMSYQVTMFLQAGDLEYYT